ncbi:TetR/AcrR family transcriptional regulator [Solihabitans fulvus]|uniref:TetR/AcrR family transcriptional regulator n=1 Tax=Solihabitans fulvus TaxID=1892852 RepID=A0A5B2XPV4_9PSEU|nr:ScbR family autoregulator-binding transcription factor [Solihabitans fulvus]KAA2264902.1 TetR/AcrR family transcriptional regulator [Solihabitans fulvus]
MPQQHRARVTREVILQAAAEEFDRVGYAGAPLSAILERGGLTKGAFYFHFSSKEALAEALVRAQDEAWPSVRREWLARRLDPLRTLVGIVNEVVGLLARDVVLRAGMRLVEEESAAPVGLPVPAWDWQRVFEDLLDEAMRCGQLRADADPCEAARVLRGAVMGARVISTTTSGCAEYPARMHEVWRYLLPGLAAPQWLAEWSSS